MSLVLLLMWTSAAAAGLKNFEGAGPLYQILLNENTLYVGGRNHLYQLDSSDLRVVSKRATGPISDNHECPPEPEACTRARHGTNDDIQVLLLLQRSSGNLLLSCGSVRQGMCRLHPAGNITKAREVGFPNDTVNFVAGRESTVAFLAPGPNDQQVIYAGAEYDGRPVNLSRYAVSSRVLGVSGGHAVLKLAHHSSTAVTAVDLEQDRFKRQHRVRYVYGFSHGGFSYFVTTQPPGGGVSPPETRVARVCQKDLNFFSYTELPVRCHRQPGDYYVYSTAAFLGPVGPDLGRRSNPSEEYLFISFAQSAERSNNTVLCSFAMSFLEEEFAKVARNCFAGEPRTHLLEAFHGRKTPCVRDAERAGKGDEFLCDYGRNRYMEGKEMISGRVRAHLEMPVTLLLVAVQWNSTVALLGTQTGHVLKFVLERPKGQLLYNVSVADNRSVDQSIRPSATLSPDKGTAYLLSGRRLVSFPLGSCRPYPDCASCLKSHDPLHCGWCGDHCAHAQECSPVALFSRNICPPVLHSVSPLSGPLQGGTLLTITGDNMGSSKAGDSGRLIVTVAGVTCSVVSWTKTLITCKTGESAISKEGPVLVNVTDRSYEPEDPFDMVGEASSEQPFQYLIPKFFGVHPLYGPSSGGTNVTISGEHLDSGVDRKILLAKQECRIWRHSNQKVECTTGPSNGSRTDPAIVCVDGACLVAEGDDRTFTYRQDPDVMTIVPNTTTISGGVVLNITGKYLNSVQNPRLIVKVGLQFPTEELELIQECRHVGSEGTLMLCPTPPLRNLSTRGVEATGRVPVRANLAFLMDGVRTLRDLPLHRRALSLLLYYPDPEYHPFPEDGQKVFFDETEIQLQGRDLAHASQNLEVILEGGYRCNVTLLRQDSLICQLPILPDIQETPYRSLEVISGNRRFSLGRLHFLERPDPPSTPTIAGVVASAIIVLLLLIAAALYLRRIRWKKKNQRLDPGYMVSFSAEDPARAQNNEYAGLSARNAAATTSRECELPDETRRLLEADNILVTREHLTLGEIIGQGHFGCVYKGELLLPNKEGSCSVAVKTLHNSRFGESQDMDSFLQEGLLMKDFHHHNVLTLIGVCFDSTPMVVLPFMKHGDLLTYIRDEARQPMVRDLLNFAAEIAQGMRYLAELKFIHRDLAARNCMLDEDMTVKVADFGLSRDVYEREYYRGDNKKSKLPVKWMAPESLEKGTYSTKTDVWSYGVVLWELLTRGVTPYPDVDNWDILQFLKQGRRMLQPSYCPNLLYKLMLQCWSEDPIKRPTFAQLVDSVQEVILKLEQKSKKRVVGLDVTYVNYPLPEEASANSSLST